RGELNRHREAVIYVDDVWITIGRVLSGHFETSGRKGLQAETRHRAAAAAFCPRKGTAKTERSCPVMVTPLAYRVCRTASRTASIPWPVMRLQTRRSEGDSQERLLLASRRSPAFTYVTSHSRTRRKSEQGAVARLV